MAIIESIMKEMKTKGIVAEATVARDKKSSAQIAVSLDSSRNYGDGIAYFKFKPNADVDWNHSARISFTEPKYVTHYSNNYKLTRDDKKVLIKMLQSTSCADDSLTGWQAAIQEFNRKISENNNNTKYSLDINLPMPDYMKLK